MTTLYCPHCASELRGHDDRSGGRCESCRLVVGAGRARDRTESDARTGGFVANAARREDAAPAERDEIFAALSAVAAEVGCAVERLRMTDYDVAMRGGAPGPSVAAVLATFETWKAARAAAGAGRERGRLETVGAEQAEVDVG